MSMLTRRDFFVADVMLPLDVVPLQTEEVY